jgi:hypothetical protein
VDSLELIDDCIYNSELEDFLVFLAGLKGAGLGSLSSINIPPSPYIYLVDLSPELY